MKTSSGEPGDRILGLTNKDVASLDTTTDYELDEADPQAPCEPCDQLIERQHRLNGRHGAKGGQGECCRRRRSRQES